MTDRTRHLTVVLDEDMRVDDVEYVVDAIQMIKCVDKVVVGDPPNVMERMTAKQDLIKEFHKFYMKLLGYEDYTT